MKNILLWSLFAIAMVVGIFGFMAINHKDKSVEIPSQQLNDGFVVSDPSLQWNRYETRNFEILSIDDEHGKFAFNNIEYLKVWVFNRWGIKDINFDIKCKVILVPSKDLYLKLFSKNISSFRRDQKGSAMWLISVDRWNTDVMAKFVTEMCLSEMEYKYQVKFGFWAHRGMSILNGNLVEIKGLFDNNNDIVFSKTFLNSTYDEYLKMSEAERMKFDISCAAFCLMIKKDVGGKFLLDYLDSSRFDVEKALSVLKINNYSHLDSLLQVYLKNSKNKDFSFFTW